MKEKLELIITEQQLKDLKWEIQEDIIKSIKEIMIEFKHDSQWKIENVTNLLERLEFQIINNIRTPNKRS